jgi:hypothetical protein
VETPTIGAFSGLPPWEPRKGAFPEGEDPPVGCEEPVATGAVGMKIDDI